MEISWVALNRIMEKKMATDATYRERVAGRPVRSSAKRLTDGELLAKLQSFGITMDRSSLKRLCEESLSAEELARPLMAKCAFKTREDKLQGDWVWVCLDALWQRWFPDTPSFEMLDDKMQAGYELKASGNLEAACRIWLDAWNDVRRIGDKGGIQSIGEFDDEFHGTQSLFNWIQNVESELWNAGLKDRQFFTARVALCEEALEWIEADEELLTENFQRGLAETCFELGQTAKADELYRDWLETDPLWGWGWIGWSDCYRFSHTEFRDWHRAEALLRKGLSIAGVRDYQNIVERLAGLYQEQGRDDEAKEVRQLAERKTTSIRQTIEIVPDAKAARHKTIGAFGDEGLPLSDLPKLANLFRESPASATGGRKKTGRNDPCPCGSGKKFKKCCAA
ncbi:MAG: SEC-C metal-binding domain-containing protein [Blastocatellia bacterium]